MRRVRMDNSVCVCNRTHTQDIKLPSAGHPRLPIVWIRARLPNSYKYLVSLSQRDGIKLHTVIIVPKGAKGAPILLTRTPYDASALTSHVQSSHLGPILQGYDN